MKTTDLDFFLEADKNADKLLAKKVHKNIIKKIKEGLTLLAEPEIMGFMLSNVKPKKQKKYNYNTIISIVENTYLYYTTHSKHSEDKFDALSATFLEVHFSHFTEAYKIFNTLWTRQYRGNNLNHNSNSYERNTTIKSRVFSTNDVYATLIKNLIDGTTSLEEYTEFYNKKLLKQTPIKNIPLGSFYSAKGKLVSSVAKTLDYDATKELEAVEVQIEKTTKEEKTVRVLSKKTVDELTASRVTSGIEYMKTQIENPTMNFGIEFNAHRYKKYLRELEDLNNMMSYNRSKNTYTFTFEASVSKNADRIYTPFNRLSSQVRNIVFQDGIEVDIDNMAFMYYLKEYGSVVQDPNRFKALRLYTSSNKAKDVARRDISKFLGCTVKETKKIILSILFGSTDRRAFKSNVFLISLLNEIKSIRHYIMDRDNSSFEEAKTTMANEFMRRETLIMNTLLSKLKLKRDNVIDIHDGLIIPYRHITDKTIQKINSVEKRFGVTFSGKRRIASYLEFKARQDKINDLKKYLTPTLLKTKYSVDEAFIDGFRLKVSTLLVDLGVVLSEVQGTNFFECWDGKTTEESIKKALSEKVKNETLEAKTNNNIIYVLGSNNSVEVTFCDSRSTVESVKITKTLERQEFIFLM